MKKHIITAFILLISIVSFAQNGGTDYSAFIQKADISYNNKQYLEAANYYSKAFNANSNMGKVKDRLKSASCWALLNNNDSAFYQLYRIAKKSPYTDYEELQANKSFTSLHNDKRWNDIISIMQNRKQEIEDQIKNAPAPISN
ncbi:tetratricopeptide repeat protein [Ferruginibacter sp. SUN106]|uniref:tetratricopeptide repeat protein n=1 Tax=Ferruginibacter sp. SUN106 TaxID=2978348 RepID=UPI003D36BF8D